LRVYKEARNYFTLYFIEVHLFIKHNRFRRIGYYRIGQIIIVPILEIDK